MILPKLVRWSYDRRRRVLALWLVSLIVAGVLASTMGGENDVDYGVDGSDSDQAVELLQERFPDYAGGSVDVVYSADTGVSSPDVEQRIDTMTREIAGLDHVVSAEPGPGSPDGTTGLVQVRFDEIDQKVPTEVVGEMVDLAGEASTDDLRIELGGLPVETYEQEEGGSEMIGMIGAIIVLLIAFGTAVAAGLPLLIAGLGLGISLSGVWLMANVIDIADWAVQLAVLVGLGVGIDYALFIVTRYRSSLAEGKEPRDAVITAGTTAGRAVVFAGATAMIALFGLVLLGNYYLGVALAVSLTILTVVLASVTVLPAMLGFAGHSINRLRLPWYKHHSEGERTLAWRWSRLMQRRPWTAAIGATVVLLALTAPALDLRLGQPDAGNHPTEMTSRRAYDMAAEGFGAGFNGPLLVAVDLAETDSAESVVGEIDGAIQATDGVAATLPPDLNDAGDAAVIVTMPETGPQDEATQDLVHELRDEVLPSATASAGIEDEVTAHVGGTTAAFIDDADRVTDRLAIFVGGVIFLSFLLLVAVFRSIPVALKAAVMNLLSVGAAYGVVAIAAKAGWFGQLIGIDNATPVPAWLPALLFAVLFGLSMDYEVFLLSRIREGFLRSGDTSRAVADGLANTARVITAAAAIMVVVALAFVVEDLVLLKLAGIGLATAIFVDATIVRMILVPSAMELLGNRNWWMPRWLDRILPRVDVDGEAAEDSTDDGAVADAEADVRREPAPVA